MKLTAKYSLEKSDDLKLGKAVDYHVKTRLVQQIANAITENDKLVQITKVEPVMTMANPSPPVEYSTNLYVLSEYQRESIRQDFEIMINKYPDLKGSLSYILDNMIGR